MSPKPEHLPRLPFLLFIVFSLLPCFTPPFLKAKSEVPLTEALDHITLDSSWTTWEVLHCILVQDLNTPIKDLDRNQTVPAIQWLLTAHDLPHDQGATIVHRHGKLKFAYTPGQAQVQGHRWQFLANLLSRNVALNTPVYLPQEAFPLHTILKANLQDLDLPFLIHPPTTLPVSERRLYETGFILETLATLPPDLLPEIGIAPETIPTLIMITMERGAGWGSCVGTHDLQGLASWSHSRALPTRVQQTIHQFLESTLQRATSLQNGDGSFPVHWTTQVTPAFDPLNYSESMLKIYITGHMLQWITSFLEEKAHQNQAAKNAYQFLLGSQVEVSQIRPFLGPVSHATQAMRQFEQYGNKSVITH